MKKGSIKSHIIVIIALLIIVGILYYAFFPAINPRTESFYFALLFILVILGLLSLVSNFGVKNFIKSGKVKEIHIKNGASNKFSMSFFILAGICVLVLIVGSLFGAEFFRAKAFASLQPIEESDFTKDLEESNSVKNIALMDTESAKIFGNRKIGSLSELVSQYEVEDDYNQISLNDAPMKVSPLKYASFFKFLKNKNEGIPGYVKVNPVNSNAEYVKLDKGMKYVPSGYFNYNLQRHVQFQYPSKLISGYYFELDEQGNPYYVCPTVSPKIGLFAAKDVTGVIICDPVSGDCKYYESNHIPNWVDHVYDGDWLVQKYNWNGLYQDGYWNTVFSQTGCKKATEDYGFKIIDNDVWIYTGVTSITGDKSNVGFVLMNERTSEAKYYKVSGAEEFSAMSSAEGAVQEKGYKASFPSLINVSGQPTYIMVLKDSGGLVKMYAMVNVEQYNIVATATSQDDVFLKYHKLLASSSKKGSTTDTSTETKTITIKDIQLVVNDGNTTVYIKDQDGTVYKQLFSDNEKLITLNKEDSISVTFEPMEDGINYLQSFTK